MLSHQDNTPPQSGEPSMLCPACLKENRATAKFCAHCGLVLKSDSSTTVIVPAKPVKTSDDKHLTNLIQLHADALILYVLSRKQPMIVNTTQSKLVMGRWSRDPKETKPEIDFSEYDGQVLGVSRQHAFLHVQETGFTLEDLGSANGTFVNEDRLKPNVSRTIKSGDLIRLGQLIVYVYFSQDRKRSIVEQPVEEIAEHDILLLEYGDTTNLATKDGISVNYMNKRIMPYLRSITELQVIIDVMLGRNAPRLEIHSFKVNKSRDGVEVKILGYPEAIQQIYSTLTPWKDQQGGRFNEESLQQLVDALLKGAVPNSTTEQRKAYFERLLPFVQVLYTSSLGMSLD